MTASDRVCGNLTTADDLSIHPPVTEDGEQERKRIHDWHGQTQL